MKTIILISALVLAVSAYDKPPTNKVLLGYEMDNRDGCVGYRHNYKDAAYVKYMCCKEPFPADTSFKGFTTNKNDLTVFDKFDKSGLSDGKHNCVTDVEYMKLIKVDKF